MTRSQAEEGLADLRQVSSRQPHNPQQATLPASAAQEAAAGDAEESAITITSSGQEASSE